MEWKNVAGDLIKNNASFDEFKQQMRNMSARASVIPSPASSMSFEDANIATSTRNDYSDAEIRD